MIDVLTLARETPAEALPELIGQLAQAHALALSRLVTPAHTNKIESEPERLLSAEEAAPLVGMTPAELVRRRNLPFRRSLGRRTVRYSARGIERWLRKLA